MFSVDGGSYSAESIMLGKAPEWAQTTDPMVHDCPILSEADISLADALASEDGFLEMPDEPRARTVTDFLLREPLIARLVANVERKV